MASTKVTTPVIKDGAVTSAKLDTNIAIDGNLTVDTNTLYVDSTDNRVGIGTTSPSSTLEIAKNDQTNGATLSITNSFDGIDWNENDIIGTIDFKITDGSTAQKVRGQIKVFDDATSSGTYSGYNAMSFSTANLGVLTERMRITSSGVVSVGAVYAQSNATFSARRNGANIEFGHTNNSGGYYGTLGAYGSNGSSYIGFSCDNDDALNTFTTRGSKGNIITGDTGGDLIFSQVINANASGQTPTERMRIDSSGRVGIGVTPNAWSSASFTALQLGVGASIAGTKVAGTGDQIYISANTYYDGTTWRYIETNPASNYYQDNGEHVWRTAVNGAAGVTTTFSERMRITSGGDISFRDTSNNEAFYWDASAARLKIARLEIPNVNATNEIQFTGTEYSNIYSQTTSGFDIGTNSSSGASYLRLLTENTERMRITSGGDVYFGGIQSTPSTSVFGGSMEKQTSVTGVFFKNSLSVTTTGTHAQFINPNGTVGTIQTSGSATLYNTSSDYRLKENVVPITGALDRIDALKPSRFNFIADADKTVDGFLAHEVAEVVPEAISGEKDAVDEEGNAIYQGIDQSKLVPLLVGAIQELKGLVQAQQAEIETLKSQINN
jgi:hypothetical protein